MVGDIDFLAPIKDLDKTQEIFLSLNYKSFPDSFSDHKHLPRLVHKNKIAAVEIHSELLKKKV